METLERTKFEMKIGQLIEHNTKLTLSLKDAEDKQSELDKQLMIKDIQLAKEQEINILIKDCISRFSRESDIKNLTALCAEYITSYYKPDQMCFYMRNDLISDSDLQDSDWSACELTYKYVRDSSLVETPVHNLHDIMRQMFITQQLTKILTTFDLRNIVEGRTKSALVCKVQYSNNLLGYVMLEYAQEKSLSADNLLNTVIDIFANSYFSLIMRIILARSYKSALDLSYSDALTGILNSRKFHEDVELLVQQDDEFVLIAIDVDSFKQVNDVHGHDAGDEVLRFVAQSLNNYMGELGGNGYRTGGDEFLGISHRSLEETEVVLKRMLQVIWDEKFESVSKQTFSITNSVGVYQRKSGESIEIVKKKADSNLYASKEAGKARYTIDQDVDPYKEVRC